MKIRSITKIRYARRWFKNRFEHRSLILLYHRVAEVSLDPWMLCVSPRNFADHLEVIRKYNLPISLRELNSALRKRILPRRSVAVTFDDGYADNLHEAKPLLERYGVPATIFVATGNMDHAREFWWDALDKILLQPGTLPESLTLNIAGNSHHWELKEAATYSAEDYRRHLKWNAWGRENPTLRHTLYRALHGLIQALLPDEQETVLDYLLAWSGAQPEARLSHRSLSREEVVSSTLR